MAWLTHGCFRFGKKLSLSTHLLLALLHSVMKTSASHNQTLLTDKYIHFQTYTHYVLYIHFCKNFSRLPPRFIFNFLDEVPNKQVEHLQRPSSEAAPTTLHPFPARVVFNQRVTHPSHFQDVRHIEFDITGSNIQWAEKKQFKPLKTENKCHHKSNRYLTSQVQCRRCCNDEAL